MALNVAGDFRYDLILSLDHNCDPAVSRLWADRTENLDHWLSEDTELKHGTTGGDFLIILKAWHIHEAIQRQLIHYFRLPDPWGLE